MYMWEGTTSRVMVADKPYCEFYHFYSASLEYFVSTLAKRELLNTDYEVMYQAFV
jgi:hypothetical protein